MLDNLIKQEELLNTYNKLGPMHVLLARVCEILLIEKY